MTVLTVAPDTDNQTDNVLSSAIVAYLGYGTARSPQRNMNALLALRDDTNLLCSARNAINDVLKFDDENLTLDQVPVAVTEYARRVRPDLSTRAVEAIVWNYCCGWR